MAEVSITSNPAWHPIGVALAALEADAKAHKRSAEFHRRRAQEIWAQIETVKRSAGAAGIPTTTSAGDTLHG